MDHKLSVLVQTDLDGRSVCLLVTEASQQVLSPLIRRTLAPAVTNGVDLTAADHVEAAAVDLLRWALDHDRTVRGGNPVELLTPAELPNHPPVPAPAARTRPRTTFSTHRSA